MLADYHVHTEYSDDSTYCMEHVITDAIRLGLEEICFTDHVDYGVKWDWDSGQEIKYRNGEPLANVDYPRYMEEIKKMQALYGSKIRIRTGLEFGIQTHTIPMFRSLYHRYPFDFIILSIHQVNDQEFWTYPFPNVKPLIEEILKTVITDGKGIEVNTSSYRYGLSDTTPSREILKLYKALGGKIITIGSDSHRPEHLGTYIKETKELLKELDYTHFCTYERMVPIFHPL